MTQIFPAVKIAGHKVSVGRATRFVLGVGVVVHTVFFWQGVWQAEALRLVLGVALIDVTLIVNAATAWKTRNG